MFQKSLKVRLGVKIFGGFGLPIALLAIISAAGLTSLSMIVNRWHKSDLANNMAKVMLEARRQEKNYLLRNDSSYVKKVDDLMAELQGDAESAAKIISSPQEKQALGQAMDEMGKYKKAFHLFVDSRKEQDAALKDIDAKTLEIAKRSDSLAAAKKSDLDELMTFDNGQHGSEIASARQRLDDANQVQKLVLEAKESAREFFGSQDPQQKTRFQARIEKILSLGETLKSGVKSEAKIAQVDRMVALVRDFNDSFAKCVKCEEQEESAKTEMVRSGGEVLEICEKARSGYAAEMSRYIDRAKSFIEVVSALAILIGLGMAYLLTRGITKPLKLVIDGLSGGAEQVTDAATLISATSQRLAEASSQQAAAIEQTSSAIEEMSSMSRQSADNATQANALMAETKQTVTEAEGSMAELMESMSEISKASEQTSRIVKTIDEIAFQTNLLALNAAVEAARAGEAGAGFAVVADEVRNLAVRAAEAAKNTSDLITTTVVKIKGGLDVVGKTSRDFSKVADSSVKVADLVSEIASASSEQAQGIEQISNAISDMDRAVQQNAADAEESAAASEEMSAQSVQMKGFVDDLEVMVDGHGAESAEGGGARPVFAALPSRLDKRADGGSRALESRQKPAHRGREYAALPSGSSNEPASPEKVIPFDEKDFDF